MKRPCLLVTLLSLFVICIPMRMMAAIGNDTIYSSQTICSGSTPVALTGTVPTGGTLPFTYKWQNSTTSATTGYTTLPGATSQGYAPGALTATRWYRRIATSGLVSDTAAPVQITVTPIISHASNTITAAQGICFNTVPAALNGSAPTGGDGVNYTYVWQWSADNLSWTTIAGATSIGYAPPPLTTTIYYRRVVSSGNCSDISTSIKITVSPVITNNVIKTDQSICTGQTPLPLTGTTPGGGTGTFAFLWQSSTTSATTGFATASGTTNAGNYTPGSVSQTTWFRRVVSSGGCTDTSATIQVTTFASSPGNPAVFGNNVWNVYGYTDNAFTFYAGYYTEPSLSFATTSRYTNIQSPSYASGYQGCLIPITYFSASMKRTNFTAGYYQVDLTSVDDCMYLLVNGVQVYTRCSSAATNIWTGYLGPTDQVEIKWSQNAGPSNLAVNFTPVTPASLNPGTIGSNQSVCYGDTPPAGFANTLSPTSGCTFIGYQWQSSVDSITWNNIAGATALTYTVSTAMTQTTWYRRVTSDYCLNTAATVPVKITVNVISPGDPTVFGDNIWNAYAYTYPAGNTNFSAATYKGFYTEPSLSFNSTSRWPNGGSPSVASGYQGCYVATSYNWMSYKRTDFAPAIYQIDIPAHDDYAYLYINGILVFSHISCCDAHTNVWTGPLGATDQVEFRVLQLTSGSYGAITLTPVTPATLTPGTITPNQTVCAGNTPPTPMVQATAPTGGCTIQGYQWQTSTDNGGSWANISGATASGYTVTSSVFTQTLYRRIVYDVCGNSANSLPDTVYMDNSAPGNPAVFGNNTWNVYCYQDVNYSIYAGYYTEPNLTFNTSSRYATTATPSSASGYLGCQLINTYYSTSMKRTGFTAGTYQIDITADDDFTSIYINGTLVSSLQYPTIQNNVWTGPLGPSDQIEVRWRNNAGPGQTAVRFTTVTPTPLTPGTITPYNPNLCTGDIPIVNNAAVGSGGCYINYSWQSSTDGGGTWTTIPGATDTGYTASVSPTVPTQFRRVANDVCGNTGYSNVVTFTPGAGAVGDPTVYGNGAWNVYAYNANGAAFSTAIYMGYYTEPLLSFSSLNRWSSGGSPSNASGYQGCQVSADYHWVSYRRTNFTPGIYQLDIPTHDDDVFIFINGVQVFTHVGCCDTHINIWTGSLGATDKVEFRWHEYNGGSNGALNLTIVTPSIPLVGGTVASDQTICSNTIPVAFTNTDSAHSSCYIYYQWQYSTACTGTWTNIAGATGLTYAPAAITASTCYRRMATDACGATAYSNTITVSIYSTTIVPGTVSSSQVICKSATPAILTSTLPTGGDGNYTYQWQSSPDGIAWSNIASATASSFSPPALTLTTWYRRNVFACGTSNTASSASVTITVNQPPVITTQPSNAVACSGGNTTVSVTATGTGLTYQWQVNTGSAWANVTNNATYSGAATALLSITGAALAMNGYQYRVIITGTCTPVLISNAVTLTIGVAPSIGSQPANITACIGNTTGFNITASGSGLTYQWQQKIGAGAWTSLSDAGVYSGTATANLVLTGITAGMNTYQYQCLLTTSCGGTLTSSAATLTVVGAITNNVTADQSVCTGMTAAALTGTTSGAYSYQWQSSTVSTSSGFVTASGTSTNYNYNPNPVSGTSYYRRIVSNTGCTSTSNALTITINPSTLSISGQPVDQVICAGGTATYTVTANGPGTLTYQWYEYNGSAWSALTDAGIYSGSTTQTLTITGATSGMNAYRYYVKIFASGCTANSLNSNSAALTTNSYPQITYNNPDIITCSGVNVNITTAATGLGLTYQWQQNTGSGWNNMSNFGVYSNVTQATVHIYPVSASLSGTQYRCIVSGTCAPGTATTSVTNLTVNPPIATNSVSSSQTLCAGTPSPFTVTNPTGGDGSYTYQWQQNTGSGYSFIAGATAQNYSPGALSQTTQFVRTVYDGACAINNSIAVTITINPPTAVTADPVPATVCAGTNTGFSVTATGTGVSYQWQVSVASGPFNNISNGTQYTGTATANLTVLAPTYAMNGNQYRCVVSGNCAPTSIPSNPAILNINAAATITGQPANVNSCQGSTVTYHLSATGSSVTYQWMEKVGSGAFTAITDGGVYSGSQTATLTLTGITTTMNTNQYLCVVTANTCPLNSAAASLTVNAQPTLVITNPGAVCAPGTVDLTAAAVTAGSTLAGGTLTYWKDAATTVVLSSPASVTTNGTYYIRVATSPVCYDVKPVLVTITPKPTLVITNPAPVCTPNTVDLTAPAVTAGSDAGLTYTYFTDAGATTTLSNPNAIATTGTYYIKGSTSGGCYTVASVTATINALPTATISYPGSPYCATGTATPTQTGQTGGTYASTAGLIINASTGVVNLATSTAGTYIVTYSFTNGTCPNTTTTSITINALPTATISYPGSPYCATATATPTQTGQTGGTYASTAGLIINASTGVVNLATSTAGTYIVTYSFTNGTCPNTTTTSITINALPTASISYPGSPYCATGSATPTQTGQTGGTYASTAGLIINASTGVVNLATSAAGTYTVTYSFTNGTCPNTTTTSITINALPTATISYPGSPYCATATATPTQTGQTGGTYASTAGLIINASTGVVNLATSTAGTYIVAYSFTNGTCPNTTTTSITINALPTASISYPGSPYCATATATPTQTGQTGGTYASTAGLIINASTGVVNLATSTAGTYIVTYSFTNGTCPNTTTTSITINALPTATISYPGSPYCATGSATPTQTGQTGGTYASTAGLIINASTGVVNLATSTAGTYTVTYSFTNGTCPNTTTTSITINALPTATISYPGSPYCATGTATPTQTGQTGGTYASTAGLIINASTGVVNLATSTAGTYTVTYSFTNGTCPNTTTTSITINALPTAAISYPGSPYCATGTATPTQTGQTGGTYASTTGLTIDATTGVVDLIASTAGTYIVTYNFTNGTCPNTTTASITINALPTATISYPGSPYCATGTATPTQTGQTGGTYASTAGLIINASTGVVNLATSTAGTYTVTYSFTNGTCPNTTTTTITINALPTATISYPGTPYCATGTATPTQTGQTGGTYASTTGLTIDATTGVVDLIASTSGTYTVTYSFTNGTCPNTTTTSITINALPTATISYPGSPYCAIAAGTATPTITGQTGGTYASTAGLIINASTGVVNLATSTAGTYTVTYSFTNGTCPNTTTTSITINALPTATISYPGSPYCATATATPTQTGQTGGTYASTAGLIINASTGVVNLATSTAGTYIVTYSFTNGTCPNTTSTTITINALPTATISYPGSPYCATGTATPTQTGQTGGTYSSTTGLVINGSTGVVNLTTSTAGTYTVTYSFTNGTCPNTTTTSITINALPTATISYPGSPYCATGTATPTQTGQTGGTYASTAGLIINASTGVVNLATSTAGTYIVAYSFTNGTCPNTTTTSITINALPTATISYAGSPYCATGTATPTQTGQTGGTFASTAGLTIDATTGIVDLVASTPGTYTVTYSFTNGTCPNTTTTSITINALPTAAISYPGSPYCATGTATPTQTGQTGGTYASTAGLIINASTGVVNLATSMAGTYTVTYSFTNGTCPNTTTTSITINALPTAAISYPGSPYCATGTATPTQTGQTGGTYASTAGLVINASTGVVNLVTSTAGTYTVTYSFTNGTCPNTTTTVITINALPTAAISYTGTPYCAAGTATPTQTGTSGGIYSSTTGLTIDATTGFVDLIASTAGTYTVTYSFTNGTCPNTTTTTITINALPTATISYPGSPYCAIAAGTATPTITGQTGGTYSSTTGLVINGSTGVVNLTTSTAGTYTVTYSFTNGTCPNTTTTSITINALPTATISYPGSPYCAASTATPTQTGQAAGTYASTTGLTIDPTTGIIDLVASTPGTYTVTYSFTNGICANTTTGTITINALPNAAISYPGNPYCGITTGTATPTQTGTTGGAYSSTAGLVINASTGAVNLGTSTPGNYIVTYSFTNGTCPNTTTTSIGINALPTATISYPGSPYCATGTAIPTQTGQAAGTYASTTGLTIDPTTGIIDLVASTAGTYTVTYSFTNGTCPSTTTTTITINALPTASISYPGTPYCATGAATPTQTGQTGGTYSSTTGLVINASTGVVNLATSTAGTYIVTYNFTNGTCPNTTTASITINALPTATISYPGSPYCATGTATPTQTGQAGGTYASTTGLTIDPTTGIIDLVASTAGTYTVTYSFTNGTCPNTTTTSITINALPTASISYTASPFCTVGTATPTQTGTTGGTYTSTTGLAINATTGIINLATSTTGTYIVTYSFTNGTCPNTTTTTIIIRKPTLLVTDPAPVCSPTTVDLTQTSITTGSTPGLGFTYYTDAAGTTTLTNPNAVNTSGTYYIKGTISSTGCYTDILPVIATVNTPPTLSITGNTDICKSSLDTLIAHSPGSTIQWSDNLGTGDTILVAPVINTVYTAVATNAVGCYDTASITVQVRPFTLNLTATPDPVVSGTTVTLNTSANFAYQVTAWLPQSDFSDQTATFQSIVVHDTSRVFYVVAMSAQGCMDTASLEVNVDVNTRDFFIPNAFTPNNDGKNDIFKVYGSSIKGLEMRVFNQWGELIFESHDPQKGWDGNIGGRLAPIGIYIYAVKAVLYNDKTITKKGTVSLIR